LVTLDVEPVQTLRTDYTKANVNEQDGAMLDYVAQLTSNAVRFMPADIDRLRQVGFTDQAILQINLIASWFNYVNRVADGLEVGR
jgi:alkylhydroperoxidase family enzyme